jgi:DNA primase
LRERPAERYLSRRSLRLRDLPRSTDLRFARLSFDGSADLHPALIAAVTTVEGEFAGIQRTFLTDRGEKLDPSNAKRSLGIIKGNAIRIFDSEMDRSHAYVCEGLEDGLSLARLHDDGPVFVAAGAGMMRFMNLPSECRSVVIGADNDRAGLKAAEEAAAVFRMRGVEAFISKPDWRHKDWNEFIQSRDRCAADTNEEFQPW